MATKLANEEGPTIGAISNKEYIGRMPIVGRSADGQHDVLAYFPTGRSGGSKARYLNLMEDGSIRMDPSSDAKEGQGNPALIYYNALKLLDNGNIVVTNGAQTDLIADTYDELIDKGINPFKLLQKAFKEPHMMDNFYWKEDERVYDRIDITSFEPDAPNYTPRTSAVLGKDSAAMCIAFCNDGKAEKHYFDIPLIDGVARGLPTYTGQNVPSGQVIPHFEGSPISFPVVGNNAEEFAQAIFNSLGPKTEGEGVVKPGDDFRVGVVALFRDRATQTLDYHVINTRELKEAI